MHQGSWSLAIASPYGGVGGWHQKRSGCLGILGRTANRKRYESDLLIDYNIFALV